VCLTTHVLINGSAATNVQEVYEIDRPCCQEVRGERRLRDRGELREEVERESTSQV
jgi:hypothetical protein